MADLNCHSYISSPYNVVKFQKHSNICIYVINFHVVVNALDHCPYCILLHSLGNHNRNLIRFCPVSE
jgi:hypothetical protein